MADDYQHESPEARTAEAILAGVHVVDWKHPASSDLSHTNLVFLCGFQYEPSTMPPVPYKSFGTAGMTCHECIKKLKKEQP